MASHSKTLSLIEEEPPKSVNTAGANADREDALAEGLCQAQADPTQLVASFKQTIDDWMGRRTTVGLPALVDARIAQQFLEILIT